MLPVALDDFPAREMMILPAALRDLDGAEQ
jgi:hypothetical protein